MHVVMCEIGTHLARCLARLLGGLVSSRLHERCAAFRRCKLCVVNCATATTTRASLVVVVVVVVVVARASGDSRSSRCSTLSSTSPKDDSVLPWWRGSAAGQRWWRPCARVGPSLVGHKAVGLPRSTLSLNAPYNTPY